MEIFEDLNDGKRSAREDGFLLLKSRRRIKKAYVLVHVEDVAVAEAFDILGNVDDLLDILVLSIVEDRIIDYDPINIRVGICFKYSVFDVIA